MVLLKGAEVSAKIKEQVQKAMEISKKPIPKLAIIRVGENADDISYERGALKKLESFGLAAEALVYPGSISESEFKAEFKKINENPLVGGILLLRPLPKHICEADIQKMIDPSKDLDGISPVNIARVFHGDQSGFAPCTAEAVMEILKANKIRIKGKKVVILGRSMVVGKPLSMLMLQEDATVTICHSRTVDLEHICKSAEILVTATGRPRMVNSSYVGKDAVVIDVGINVDQNGKLCGDLDFDSVKDAASMATPVPGGVGVVTTAVLAKHLVRAAGVLRDGGL